MAYPDDKETWERVDTNDIITKEKKNNISIFLEALQDTLGLGIKLGYGTVKLLLDYLKSKADLVDGKVNRGGDIMTGNLYVQKANAKIRAVTGDYSKEISLYNEGTGVLFSTHDQVEIKVSDGASGTVVGFEVDKNVASTENEFECQTWGKGLRLYSPDGTKHKRVMIDNAGNLVAVDI